MRALLGRAASLQGVAGVASLSVGAYLIAGAGVALVVLGAFLVLASFWGSR